MGGWQSKLSGRWLGGLRFSENLFGATSEGRCRSRKLATICRDEGIRILPQGTIAQLIARRGRESSQEPADQGGPKLARATGG